MKLNLDCIVCNINQVLRTAETLGLGEQTREKIMREVLAYLSTADYECCNPEVIAGTWERIIKHTGNKNPYKEIKSYYNKAILNLWPELKQSVSEAEEPIKLALKYAVAGNLVDFAAKHEFDLEELKKKLVQAGNTEMSLDDSGKLLERLEQISREPETKPSLLCLGDNCGEIVLDKLLIETLRDTYPDIHIYYGVRGKAIVNDVTLEDAAEVRMEDAAEVVDNGDGSLGTVLSRTSKQFREIFERADIVLCKGQGNYESLSEVTDKEIYHLFMAKCEAAAGRIGVPVMSVVCARQRL